jgi:hypothetical protein
MGFKVRAMNVEVECESGEELRAALGIVSSLVGGIVDAALTRETASVTTMRLVAPAPPAPPAATPTRAKGKPRRAGSRQRRAAETTARPSPALEDRSAAVLAALKTGPKTPRELEELTGTSKWALRRSMETLLTTGQVRASGATKTRQFALA